MVVDARSDEAIHAMTAYFGELNDRFPEGFDPGDTLVADAHHFDPPSGVFLIARSSKTQRTGGGVIACGGAHCLDGEVGEIKRMWVAPNYRGKGIGRSLLGALEAECARIGYSTVRLDTNSVLTQAISLYETAGYRPIPAYNDNPFAKAWFEKTL